MVKKKEATGVTLIQARVPADLAKRVKIKAVKEGTTLQQLVNDLLTEYVKRPAKAQRDEQ
jgi:predicted DNA binding CopG/RHH family protein